MNRFATTLSACVAIAFVICPTSHAAEALLIPEVITREISIHVGGIQSPETQYVETREVSLFVGEEPEPPYQQVESREVSLVVSDAAPPPRIEELEVTLSPTGDVVTLDWSGYDQYAVRDVVRYDIYYSARAFANIAGMIPFASVGGENFLWTQGGFPQWQDHFFAVVPVDGQGNRISQIVYFGGYPLMPETMTREVSLFIGAEPEPPYRHVESREVSLVVSDPSAPPRIEELEVTLSPTGDVVTLDWTGYDQWAVRDAVRYDIYYSDRAFADITGMTPFATVGGENFRWTQGGFPQWQDHFFAVIPVDGQGNQISQIVYFGAYPLMPETMTREVSLFIGEEPEPPYRMVESREVGLVVADDTIPAPVTGAGKVFDANISEHQYGGVYLNWNDYDLWAQRDVIGYRIYYSDRFFSDVNESGVRFAGLSQDGLMATMVSGAFEPKVYYFAVVAEDAAGNFDPLVYSRSTKDPIPSLWEFALGNVKIGSSSLADLGITWSVEENHIEYRYARRNLAVEAGTSFLVEWSEDLENWYIQGVSQIITADNGEIQNIKALVPRSGRAKLFVRLKVVPNTGQTGSGGQSGPGGQGVSVSPITPPQIIAQPTSLEILSGSTTTLSVKVNSTAPRTYQWYRGNRGDTSSPVGTNASTFVTPALTADTRYWVRISNAAGSVDSAAALVTMAKAPVITAQPASVTIANGQTATLSVAATGSTPLIYQWYQGAVGVTSTPVGLNSGSFTTPVLSATTSYWVKVENWMGTISSSAAIVSVIQLPTIVTQPSSRTVYSGDSVTLSVGAQGDGSLSFQWYRGEAGDTSKPLGLNSPDFVTPPLTGNSSFWVHVRNSIGGTSSAAAWVTVREVPGEMRLIPSGTFLMGRASGDTDADAPPVTVHVSSVLASRFEVTKSEWDEVRTWGLSNGYADIGAAGGKASNHPVQNITWWDAVKWCNARSEKEGFAPCYRVGKDVFRSGTTVPEVDWNADGYRLPTEAEWEKSARGGESPRRFPWGDTISHLQANYTSSTSYSYDVSSTGSYHPDYATGSQPFTAPVGSFAPNRYGLHDMAGNVHELCWDWHTDSYVDGASDPKGAASGTYRVYRGGSWSGNAFHSRISNRRGLFPPHKYTSIGMRVFRNGRIGE